MRATTYPVNLNFEKIIFRKIHPNKKVSQLTHQGVLTDTIL
jgi:hypothetical protein